VIVVALLEMSSLILILGDSIDELVETVLGVVGRSIGRAGSPVRCSASMALRTIATQYPGRMALSIARSLEIIKMAQAEMVVGSEVQRQMDAMHGHSLALAALLAALPETGISIPVEFTDSLFDFAANLLLNRTTEDLCVLVAQREAGWNLVAGVVTGLGAAWVARNLAKLFELWSSQLGAANMDITGSLAHKDQLLCYVEVVTYALASLQAFVRGLPALLARADVVTQIVGFLGNILACAQFGVPNLRLQDLVDADLARTVRLL
jgi:hypothetical protein